MDPTDILAVVGLAALATVNVALWTFRVALAAAGRRGLASVVAGVEAGLFAVAFGSVVGSLDDPTRVAGYAVGVGLGTLVGIVADERLAGGQSVVRLVLDGDGSTVQAALHAAGWPATAAVGTGVRGKVTLLEVAVDDAAMPRAMADVERLAPGGFVTVERLRRVRGVDLGPGMHSAGRHGGSTRDDRSDQAL